MTAPRFEVIHGDAVDVMALCLEDNSVDAIVCDPPYGLRFMGRRWDYDVPSTELWAECLRVLKPGGHLLAFAGARTQHRMAVNIEDAGFEIRDMIAWVYGSGFPKSRALPDGFGSALKPAIEPITVARKPFGGTLEANYARHGTGGLNIEGCRVGDEVLPEAAAGQARIGTFERTDMVTPERTGRWPANLCHDDSAEVRALFPNSNGSGGSVPQVKVSGYGDGVVGTGKSDYLGGPRTKHNAGSGSAARFFYSPKASKHDREEGLEGFAKKANADWPQNLDGNDPRGAMPRANHHPTVKPTDLMRWLCRLVTPPGGLILDPFAGSGSTGKAAMLEGFRFVGIDREAEYCQIAAARIAHAAKATA